jgi:hypothetical protein
MCRAFQRILVVIVTVSAIGCANHRGSDPESAFASPTGPSAGPGLDSSSGGTLKETLTGPQIAGVTPEGQALADESRFQSGGSTILTVQIRKVNLPDGTVLNVSLSFTKIGTITVSRGEGLLTKDLGHFGVSRDPVVLKDSAGKTILSGGSFQ